MNNSIRLTYAFFGLALAAPACNGDGALVQTAEASKPTGYRAALISGIPHVRQKPDFCGEACVEMALRKLGHAVTQDQVFAATGVAPAAGRGAYTADLVRGIKRLGFDVGTVWYHVKPKRARKGLDAQFKKAHADLLAGTPSIVCTRYNERPNTTEHFRLLVGYDPKTDEVIYHEPAEDKGGYRRMKRKRLLSLWPLKYRKDRWTVVRIPLKPKKINARAGANTTGSRYSQADYAQHVLRLKEILPRGFNVVVQPPFVVVGDEPLYKVKQRAASTVRWATTNLKRAYFKKDPNHILDVWLLKNSASYYRQCNKRFGGKPGTPFGFYSAKNKALVMNISTGGGTLVHEIVHPFIEANFPAAPPWFNEGLGSLYEQCGSCNGEICGYTNWRLKGLQRAIRAGRVPTIKWLTSRTSHQFYELDPGTNYSQSRYLMYYLQQRKVLRSYYHTAVKNQRKDPTGYKTLVKLLGERDMKAFQKRWEAWVLKLTFP